MGDVSRRDLIRTCYLMPSLGDGIFADSAKPVTLKPAHEFGGARFLSGSPDGTKLCVEEWKAVGAPVTVVETGTWRTLYSDRFQQRVLAANFFADGEALFLNFVGPKGRARDVVADIRTYREDDATQPYVRILRRRPSRRWPQHSYCAKTKADIPTATSRSSPLSGISGTLSVANPCEECGNEACCSSFGFSRSQNRCVLC
jgi:hypothetical protein